MLLSILLLISIWTSILVSSSTSSTRVEYSLSGKLEFFLTVITSPLSMIRAIFIVSLMGIRAKTAENVSLSGKVAFERLKDISTTVFRSEMFIVSTLNIFFISHNTFINTLLPQEII